MLVCNHGKRAISVCDSIPVFGKTYEEIKEKLHAVYKDAPSMTTIRYWYNEFKHGRTSIFDEERLDRSIEVTTKNMVNKIHIVLADRRVKIRERLLTL